jgi:hypothetical protein
MERLEEVEHSADTRGGWLASRAWFVSAHLRESRQGSVRTEEGLRQEEVGASPVMRKSRRVRKPGEAGSAEEARQGVFC